jgi:hypothetical protein
MPCGRSRRSRAPCNVCPRSPRTLVAQHESVHVRRRWTAVPSCPSRLRVPFGPPRPVGKMRLPNVCNRQLLRAPCRPPDSSSCHRTGRSSLDVELRASAWLAMTPVPRAQSPLGPVGALIQGPPERRSLIPCGLFGRGKVACLASDAPCRAPSPVIEPLSKRAPEPLPPPPRQRLRLSRPEAPGRPAPLPPPARSDTPLARENPIEQAFRLHSPRLRAARRPRVRRSEARNGACQLCNPMRSASTAWDRLSPGGASFRGKRPKPVSH